MVSLSKQFRARGWRQFYRVDSALLANDSENDFINLKQGLLEYECRIY
jgi:hypothetical protein